MIPRSFLESIPSLYTDFSLCQGFWKYFFVFCAFFFLFSVKYECKTDISLQKNTIFLRKNVI